MAKERKKAEDTRRNKAASRDPFTTVAARITNHMSSRRLPSVLFRWSFRLILRNALRSTSGCSRCCGFAHTVTVFSTTVILSTLSSASTIIPEGRSCRNTSSGAERDRKYSCFARYSFISARGLNMSVPFV